MKGNLSSPPRRFRRNPRKTARPFPEKKSPGKFFICLLYTSYHLPFYEDELKSAIFHLNPALSEEAVTEALNKLKNIDNGELVQRNAVFMNYLQNGISVQYRDKGEVRSDIVYLADYNNPANNSFVVANQWTFMENSCKRPDMILFLNGLPVVLVELKSPSREETDCLLYTSRCV